MIKFLAHYFNSNSRHGTHSPFVYALADEVIYNKKYQEKVVERMNFGQYTGRYKRLLQSILNYLKIDAIQFNQYEYMANANTAVLKNIDQVEMEDLNNLSKFNVLVVFDLYKNNQNTKLWKWIQAHDKVHVSIDLYYFGLVFHRPQQRKENFKLKYPFWI